MNWHPLLNSPGKIWKIAREKSQDIIMEFLASRSQQKIQNIAEALRRHPTEFLPLVERALAMGDESRRTISFPFLSQYGIGGSHAFSTKKNVYNQALPKVTPYNLRRFSEIPPARRAITNITQQILDQQWIITTKDDSTTILSAEDRIRVAIAVNTLEHPNTGETWRQFLSRILEDIVVGGFGAAEIAPNDYFLKPYDLYAVDGQSINVNPGWDGLIDGVRYEQSFGYNNSNLQINTFPGVQLRDKELSYFMLNPRSNTPFGYGYIETAFMLINAWIGAFSYSEKRASNSTPNYLIFLGENIDASYVHTVRAWWRNSVEGTGEIPIVGGGRAPEVKNLNNTGEDPLWLKWQEFLVRMIAISCNQSPMALGLERDVNRSTAESSAQKDWQIVEPVANIFSDNITNDVLGKNFGWPHLKFQWIIRNPDEKRQAETLAIQWTMNAVTVNELRKIYRRPPLPLPQGDMTKTEYEAYAYSWSQQNTGNPQQGKQNMAKDKALALPLS